jgi:hypothetical protein
MFVVPGSKKPLLGFGMGPATALSANTVVV